jgi:hypothetical protein
MKVIDVGTDRDGPVEAHFEVKVSPNDIPGPSPIFVEFLRSAKAFSTVNSLTIGQFTNHVRAKYGVPD